MSGNYFSLLGVKPVIGRLLSPADDSVPEQGGPDGLVAVISHNYWTRRFGQNPAVVGKAIQVGNLGALLGLLVARWSSHFLVSFFAAGQDRLFVDLPLDGRVLLFTAAVALLTGLLFGLGPALRATRVDPNPALKDSAAAVTHTRSRLQASKLLIVSQVALSLLLLVGAGLFLRTLHNLNQLDAGFDRAGVLTMKVSLPEHAAQGLPTPGLWKEMLTRWQEILTRVEAIPSVRSASLSMLSPLDGRDRGIAVTVPGFTPSATKKFG